MRYLAFTALISSALLAGCIPGAQPAQPGAGSGGPVVFFSTQFKPVEEQEKMRGTILKDAPAQVEFIPEDAGPFNDRLIAEQRAGKVTVSLIGGLHGDFAPFVQAGQIEDLGPFMSKLADRAFPSTLLELSRMGTRDQHFYAPWMQATYVLAVNKKALPHLPQGADVNALSSSRATCIPHTPAQPESLGSRVPRRPPCGRSSSSSGKV